MMLQLTTALFIACLTVNAFAGDVVQVRPGERVDPRQVAEILGTPKAPIAIPGQIKWRSVRLTEDAPAEAPAPKRANGLALQVQFAFGSATIQPEARTQLDAVADGIRMVPESQSVVIEGHTDAVGSDTYNLQLSNRRAAAVKQYLVQMHGIDAARLKTAGYGEYRLINEQDPQAAENRRVEFRGG